MAFCKITKKMVNKNFFNHFCPHSVIFPYLCSVFWIFIHYYIYETDPN